MNNRQNFQGWRSFNLFFGKLGLLAAVVLSFTACSGSGGGGVSLTAPEEKISFVIGNDTYLFSRTAGVVITA